MAGTQSSFWAKMKCYLVCVKNRWNLLHVVMFVKRSWNLIVHAAELDKIFLLSTKLTKLKIAQLGILTGLLLKIAQLY